MLITYHILGEFIPRVQILVITLYEMGLLKKKIVLLARVLKQSESGWHFY